MTQPAENNGHDGDVLNVMARFNLFAIDTKFDPKRRPWDGKLRRGNATYLPKHKDRRPTKLDYVLVSNRWKSMATNSKVQWGASMHRFGEVFDHALLPVGWAWKLRVRKKHCSPDFRALNGD